MAKTHSVIDINGSRYDANSGVVIDGIRRLTRKKPTPAKATVSTPAKPAAQKTKVKPSRTASSSARAVHHRQQKSQTLLRNAVFRPSVKLKSTNPAAAKAVNKSSAKSINPARQSRAKLVKKHPLIERFGTSSNSGHSAVLSGEVLSPTAKKAGKVKASVPAAVAHPNSAASHQHLEQLLDAALLRADAHKQATKRAKYGLFGLPRRFSLALIVLILIILAAMIVWLNVPAVAVKVAALRSHMSASLPTYTPSGYNFSSAISRPHEVSITYKASSGGSYTLNEQQSNWDSKSLANSLTNTSQVQTSQVDGTTVYIYGPSNNASWVNNGTLYSINNLASLHSDQLLQIVQSL